MSKIWGQTHKSQKELKISSSKQGQHKFLLQKLHLVFLFVLFDLYECRRVYRQPPSTTLNVPPVPSVQGTSAATIGNFPMKHKSALINVTRSIIFIHCKIIEYLLHYSYNSQNIINIKSSLSKS